MDFKEIYEIEFTESARNEINEIYEYISKKLFAEDAAKKLMRKLRENIMKLKYSPEIYAKIEKRDKRRKLDFRRMVINNYVILYTIDENKKVVYVSHMYYGGRNYL